MSRFRIFLEMPWLLAGIAIMAILAHSMAAPCRAEDRPVIENSLGMKLVSIPAGEFLMGGTKQEVEETIRGTRKKLEEAEKLGDKENAFWANFGLNHLETEKPQHRVILTKPFFLGKYDVTQKEFAKIMGFNPSSFSASSKKKKQREMVVGQDTSTYPVETVSWDDAIEFCRQLSAAPAEVAAGRSYRLPSEAEWEYACRASTSTRFFWGDTCGPEWRIANEFTWNGENSDQHPHPVGQKRPNPWGLFDMGSNLSNWCADWVDPGYYAASPLRDPTGPSSGTERIVRGNAFHIGPARSGARLWHPPKGAQFVVGFRVACDVSAPAPPVVETAPKTSAMQDAEARLKEKGLARRMGYFLLPEEAQFIRYVTTIERLRMACFHAQRECQDAQRQLSRVQSAKAGAIQSRMQARTTMNYSDTWREHWASVRARNNANDAVMLVDLSKEGVQKWQKDAQADLDSAVELFAGQIDKLQKMYQKLQKDYAKLYEDATVKHALAEMNSQSKSTYRLGPTPSALAASKKLEHEQGLLAQFKKN